MHTCPFCNDTIDVPERHISELVEDKLIKKVRNAYYHMECYDEEFGEILIPFE